MGFVEAGGAILAGAAPGYVYRGADRINSGFRGIDSGLFSKIENCQSGRLLRHRSAPLPAIHRGERHAKAFCKLHLRQVQSGANGPEDGPDGLYFHEIRHIWNII